MAKSFFKKENPNFNNCGLIRRTICLYSWLVILPYKRTNCLDVDENKEFLIIINKNVFTPQLSAEGCFSCRARRGSGCRAVRQRARRCGQWHRRRRFAAVFRQATFCGR